MEYVGVALVPLLIGILEAIKKLGVNPKYVPIISMIIGVSAGIIMFGQEDVVAGVILGLAISLSAVGLYSGTKNTLE